MGRLTWHALVSWLGWSLQTPEAPTAGMLRFLRWRLGQRRGSFLAMVADCELELVRWYSTLSATALSCVECKLHCPVIKLVLSTFVCSLPGLSCSNSDGTHALSMLGCIPGPCMLWLVAYRTPQCLPDPISLCATQTCMQRHQSGKT